MTRKKACTCSFQAQPQSAYLHCICQQQRNLFFQIFLIHSWLNPQMWNLRIYRLLASLDWKRVGEKHSTPWWQNSTVILQKKNRRGDAAAIFRNTICHRSGNSEELDFLTKIWIEQLNKEDQSEFESQSYLLKWSKWNYMFWYCITCLSVIQIGFFFRIWKTVPLGLKSFRNINENR